METVVRFIVAYEVWIYAALALLGLYYLLRVIMARRQLSQTLFGLEREQVRGQYARVAGMLVVVIASLLGVFVVVTFVVPALPVNLERATLPTPVKPVGPAPDATLQVPLAGGSGPVIPLEQQVDPSGCDNPDATLTSPANGAQISGSMEVRGTAAIANFVLYKFEVAGPTTEGRWQTVAAGTTAVRDGSLGTWETAAFAPGQYAFRLVVSDTAGNSPPPCVRVVQVLPVGQSP
ncbi:MAG: hypothetical protein HY784_13160 [Chloroflexi bacterium]|nr:hypothetical protein [Chloroflexota bacterium]